MGDFAAINTALSGLLAHRRALEVISHNISNAQTEGFTRRRAELQSTGGLPDAGVFAISNQAGTGVEVANVTRMREEVLDQQVRRELGGQANSARAHDILSSIENLMPEPSDDGIAAKLSAFWSAWDDAAASPGDIPTRRALLQTSENLTTTFHQLAANLTGLRDTLRATVDTTIAQINSDSARVAELNASIAAATVSGGDAADLQDQRDLIVDRIVRTTGATTRAGEYGTVDVFLGGSTLVRSNHAERITATDGATLDPPLDTTGMQRVELSWKIDGYPVTSVGGDLAALVSGVNGTVPGYLHELDTVAASVVSSVNALHVTGHGLDTVNDVNLSFFDPAATSAATIALSTDVAGQPSRIALAAGAGGQLDGSLAHQLAALADSDTGPDALHRAVVAKLAVDVNSAASRSKVQSQIAEQALSNRDSVVGVNLDEELSNLIATQHAFEACSRVMTAVDEMLDTLINRTAI